MMMMMMMVIVMMIVMIIITIMIIANMIRLRRTIVGLEDSRNLRNFATGWKRQDQKFSFFDENLSILDKINQYMMKINQYLINIWWKSINNNTWWKSINIWYFQYWIKIDHKTIQATAVRDSVARDQRCLVRLLLFILQPFWSWQISSRNLWILKAGKLY